jgi:Holliday junction resolvase RusA-like endonuclease
MYKQLSTLPFCEQIEIEYKLFPYSNRRFDLDNHSAMIMKIFHDLLIDMNIIKDDNYKIIIKITVSFGEVDKLNPRCEIKIIPKETK